MGIREILAALAAATDDARREELRTQLTAALTSASDNDLTDFLAHITERGRELAAATASEETVAHLGVLLDSKRAALAERANRANQASLADRQAAVLAELDGTHDASQDRVQPDPAAAPVPTPKPEGEGDEGEGDEGEGDEGEQPEGKGDAQPKRRRAARDLSQLGRREGEPTAQQFAGEVTTVTRINGNIPGQVVGAELNTADAVVSAFANKAQALNRTGAAGRHEVVRVEFSYPEERTLLASASAEANTSKITAVTDSRALTAAGGLCLPLDQRTEIEVIGDTARPVKSALAGYQVERGGLQYRLPFDALVMAEGLGIWTQADDQAATLDDEGTWKSCLEVSCPGLESASIYSTYLCLQFANMTARFDNQWVRATTESSMVAWARFAENQLLSRLFAGSKVVKGVHVSGACRDVLYNLDRILPSYRNSHRLTDNDTLRWIAPAWLIDLFRADLALQMTNASPAELFNIARAALESWLRTRSVAVTWHLDGLAAPGAPVNGVTIPQQFYGPIAAGSTVPAFPAAADTLLFREGDWLFLDGGTLDLGLVRDSRLNMVNRYQTFVETFEGVAFVGKESLRLVLPVVPSGAASGTIDPRAIDPTLPVAA